MRIFLFWLAVAGWAISVIVHILSLFYVYVEGAVPYIWGLHIGVLLVWFPMVFMLKNEGAFKAFEDPTIRKGMNPLKFFRVVAARTPKWVVYLALAGFVYAFVNFALTMFAGGATPAFKDGKYYIHNRGQFIQYITEREYQNLRAFNVRRFSGHWIAFYGIAIALLYPIAKPGDPSAKPHNP